jgi:RNA polymerase sigma-70 factor, ECF subfamily
MADTLIATPPLASPVVATRTARFDLAELEDFRGELTGYCYRMLGSGLEADDAVQEAMLRAWRNAEGFEGRSSLRSWLYRIATNVCIDMSRQVQRRARPTDFGPASAPDESHLGAVLPEATWVTPLPDSALGGRSTDPAEIVGDRESVRLAFVAALQHLPPRQRAALILCEVLRWQASEVAELLDTSTPAINSALQRARSTLRAVRSPDPSEKLDPPDAELLARYVDAFERYDIDSLVSLLRDDAIQSMPPFAMWIRGAADIGRWMVQPGPSACRDSRLLPAIANGCPAFGQYRADRDGGRAPWALQVLEISGGKIVGMNFFLTLLDPEKLFPQFGLPLRLDD